MFNAKIDVLSEPTEYHLNNNNNKLQKNDY